MAVAPGHLIGQLIGNVLEAAIEPRLRWLADKHDLFLDTHGPRPGVRQGAKLSWSDDEGNTHDLDFVLERGGTRTSQGLPAAFIESAWRRYTKHSRNKAQEIQGAVLPIVRKWREIGPVPAAVVAGEWSRPAVEQMRSNGFTVLQLDFKRTALAFQEFGIDIAGDGERTGDEFWQQQVNAFRHLEPTDLNKLAASLYVGNREEFDTFVGELERRIVRTVQRIAVLPLHGASLHYLNVQDAIAGITEYTTGEVNRPFVRFEIRVTYTNGDQIDASFEFALDARRFLESFA